jgi:hypothetical protein
MSKPVTPQDMFDLWQKMVNPGAYPLQSLMFPVLDPVELEKKIAELEVVEHWLKANTGMVRLTMQSLQFQLALLKGGEKAAEALKHPGAGAKPEAPEAPEAPEQVPNPAMWAWNMMAEAGKSVAAGAAAAGAAANAAAADSAAPAPQPAAPRRKARRRKTSP